MFSALSRSQTSLPKRTDGLVLDLSQSNIRPSAPSSKTPTSFRTVPAFAASASASDGVEPKFNDPAHSDVRIEVVTGKGEIHALLHLHSNVLREQSDYFFNTLVKRALRESGSASEPPPTTFTIQTSRQVPDPEIYVTVFRLFYQEEEFISEDIVCMGSVWKVLQMLVVSAELQFHACTAACVDYLESVPWNDEELEDIVRLVPQLDRLQDAQPVLERLPIRTWDEESIADSLRILLIRAVAFHDAMGQGPITPKGQGMKSLGLSISSSFSIPSPSADAGQSREGSDKQQLQQQTNAKAGSSVPIPGTLECREAVCSVLRNHQGPLLPLKTKKVLLRETFVDLLQCLWLEQKSFTQKSGSAKSSTSDLASLAKKTSEISLSGADGEVSEKESADETRDELAAADGRDEGKQVDQVARVPLVVEPSSAPMPLLESVYGKYGALTWITGVMIEFSMADEVFKWLASDKEFLFQVTSLYRTMQGGSEAEAGGVLGRVGSDALVSSLAIVRSALLNLAAAILAKRLVVNAQLRSSFIRTWVPVLAEICTASASGEYLIYGLPITADEKATILAGYNELVLTLPAGDQRSIFQMWYLKLSLSLPASASTPRVSASTPRILGQSASQERPLIGVVEDERTNVEQVSTWFTLAPAYKRWLTRLGAPCGMPGGEI